MKTIIAVLTVVAIALSMTLVRTAMSNSSPAADYPAAAASVAAYVVLECLLPDQQPGFEMALAADLAGVPETDRKAAALAAGRQAATQLLRSTSQPCG